MSVSLAGLLHFIFIRSFGSSGIGTLVAAYFVGKIVEFLRKHFQVHMDAWLNDDQQMGKKNCMANKFSVKKNSVLHHSK